MSMSDCRQRDPARSLRRRQLLLLACVVREHGGTWGIAQAAPATEGTKVWVNLPGDPAAAY
ncbi:hypothetical protein [Streptomyces sp. ISL-11]|uniref:hypothetical protein n=1 Tax=Streptomyces sp. ISL-11 TaxID=2819174 RepID=UPI001BEB8632|nr:hypothetical protein [Streptomyces sp. ISL-11]MBT2383612.1 hypothetical protein [Streptomyces sp. ISL-11]